MGPHLLEHGLDGVEPSPAQEPQPLPPVVTLIQDAGLAHRAAWEGWHHGCDGGEESVRPAERGNGPEEAFLHYVQENSPRLKQREQKAP